MAPSKRWAAVAAMAIVVALVLVGRGCAKRNPPVARPAVSAPSTSRMGPAGIYPDPALTPGAADPRVTQENIRETICIKGYASGVRSPEGAMRPIKKRVLAAYRLGDSPSHYEPDHLISLELGGCGDCVSNLWPEPYGDRDHPMSHSERSQSAEASLLPGVMQKDRVENFLHGQVCLGAMTLEEAQRAIATGWYKVYVENGLERK